LRQVDRKICRTHNRYILTDNLHLSA
jgi:hypothetical protein